MEWIRISEGKLKIMLSEEDARRYALDCKTADCADVMTRAAFREILTDVGTETGFDASEDKVYIQMYPSKAGGCELFVTKMGLLEEAKRAKRPPTVLKKRFAYTFTEMSDLTALCRRMASRFHGESEIWRDEKGRWWLVLMQEDDCLFGKNFGFVTEYGKAANPEAARVFLPEHGQVICPQNAIEIFSAF